ncbi:hypothetical protein IDJ77_11535 [Mucilaginibacter sp. ZT4R22]|uniref:Histidine kinase n=1 Tax=Mucilaginibacter pankratovii TaxID=2772110 RepID=A0ABR7WQ39_9SPHI|nr:hypothetical protein [Mucilaginibacter pankratovii]MBD1364441.1 hypothetical protein [Mucilaginibacter pankratovii]
MKHDPKLKKNQLTYNKSVGLAYFVVLKQAKQMLSTLEPEELRYTLEREDNATSQAGAIIHELVNPLIYLRLECSNEDVLSIHFGIEQVTNQEGLSAITSKLIRLVYKHTAKEATGINIERCVKTDWLINSCSELYEYIEERNKHHTFKQIKYKVTAARRKLILAVA